MSPSRVFLPSLLALSLAGAVFAQAPPQQRPDARYPNPSGQDSKPSSTEVNPTKPAPPSTSQNSSRGAAAKDTYVTGKKPDVSGGCSTPTDAASAGAQPSRGADKTVCTTSGEGTQTGKARTKTGEKKSPSTSAPAEKAAAAPTPPAAPAAAQKKKRRLG